MFDKIKQASAKIAATALAFVASAPVFATSTTPPGGGLPSVTTPTGAAVGTNDYIGLIQGYALDSFIVLGLILGTVAFIMVAKNVTKVYGEIGNGKAEWGDMGAHLVGGVLLLVFVVFMLTKAASILA